MDKWYQTFDIDGEVMQGEDDNLKKVDLLKLPRDMKGKTVFDIGCAEGWFLVDAIGRGAKSALGIDHDPKKHERYNKIIKKKCNVKGITYKYADIEKEVPKMYRRKFDYIYCFAILHHLTDPVKMVVDLAKMCKEKIWFDIPAEKCEKWELVPRKPERICWYMGHFIIFDILKKCGFTVFKDRGVRTNTVGNRRRIIVAGK